MWSVEKFCRYMERSDLIPGSRHGTLTLEKWLLTVKSQSTGRLARWALHKQNRRRRPTVGIEEILTGQRMYFELKEITEAFENDDSEVAYRWTERGYVMLQGVLFFS